MKNFKYILLLLTLLFVACKDPNIGGPDTEVDRNEVVEYEVLESGSNLIQSDTLKYSIIETRANLNDEIIGTTATESSLFVKSIANIDFDKNTFIIISTQEISVETTITLDTMYIDSKGVIQVDYRLTRVLGDFAKVNNTSIIILLKNRKYSKINFNKKIITNGEIPKFDGFISIVKDLEVKAEGKWKTVIRTRAELESWAMENKLFNLDKFNQVNFDREMIITVGTNAFPKTKSNYEITDIQQRGNRLVVSSKFRMIENNVNFTKSANHFVKIKKTNMIISFNPTEISNDVNFGKSFYNQKFRLLNVPVKTKTEGYIKKVTNLAELFLTIDANDEINPSNLEVDFEFFDLLIIKTPTLERKALKYEYEGLKKDDFGINTKLNVFLDITHEIGNYDANIFVKILKTNIPISKNFEVIIK